MNYLKWTLAVLLLALLLPPAGCRETTMTTETQTRTTIPPEVQGDAASSKPSISADGHFVAFESDAANLVVGSTNGARSIYVKDTRAGATMRVSSTSAGVNGNKDSANPAVSADGRFVAFDSTATNLVPGDTGSQCVSASGTNVNCPDVFIKNLETGETRLVSATASGAQGDQASMRPAVSADGRFVAFRSSATNLVPGDSNGKADIFLKDMQTGAVSRISVGMDGSEGGDDSDAPVISGDGRYVAFRSAAGSLVPADGNSTMDVFLKDVQTGALSRVSTSAAGVPGDEASGFSSLALSADGRFVAFESVAPNLVPGDANGKRDVFVKDTQTGAIALASADAGGTQGDEDSYHSVSISGNGRFVAFSSDAGNLVPGDANNANGKTDIFLKDMQTGAIAMISTNSGGVAQGQGTSGSAAISGDGRFVVYDSEAANLVAGDTNRKTDVFVKDTQSGTTIRVSTSTADMENGAGDNSSTTGDQMGNASTIYINR